MLMTQGGQTLVNSVKPAGEVRDGGDARNHSTGHGLRRGWHRWNPEPRPRRLVLAGLPETTQIDGGVRFCGGRSSGAIGGDATAH